jgi:hypothetical protein
MKYNKDGTIQYEIGDWALVKEAKKRGFKGKIRIDNTNLFGTFGSYNYTTDADQGFIYFPHFDELRIASPTNAGGDCTIYQKGQWAEIIKDEPIVIGEERLQYVKFDDYIKFGCWSKPRTKVENLYRLMRELEIDDVRVRGNLVSQDMVRKVLERTVKEASR